MRARGSAPADKPLLLVVAAVIRDARGRILVARRPPGRHMAGLWEFPGGKVREGEDPEVALVRELREELGVTVLPGAPITFAVHEEHDRRIVLLFYNATVLDGLPRPLEGQEVRWATAGEIRSLSTPPADARLIRDLEGLVNRGPTE